MPFNTTDKHGASGGRTVNRNPSLGTLSMWEFGVKEAA